MGEKATGKQGAVCSRKPEAQRPWRGAGKSVGTWPDFTGHLHTLPEAAGPRKGRSHRASEKASRSLRTLAKRRRCPPSLRELRLTASHRHQEDGVPARGPLEGRRGDPDQPIELLTAQGWQPTAPGDPGPGRVCGGGRGDGRAGPSCPGRPLSRGQGLQVRLKTTPRQGL